MSEFKVKTTGDLVVDGIKLGKASGDYNVVSETEEEAIETAIKEAESAGQVNVILVDSYEL